MLTALALVVGGGVALAATIQCGGGDCFGTDRADTIFGTNRHDAIFAKKGGDVVTGKKGADNLNGQDGNDRVLGGPGKDWVKGGRHDDTVKGGKGHDRITGGSGDNIIRAADGMKDLIICGDAAGTASTSIGVSTASRTASSRRAPGRAAPTDRRIRPPHSVPDGRPSSPKLRRLHPDKQRLLKQSRYAPSPC